ncbi:MAG: phosphatase PAP2 family protein [Caulobacter sp.]|nr:phosphatase PAP2 family protein [Caulobacter sp.]
MLKTLKWRIWLDLARRELGATTAILVVASGALAFIGLADEAAEGGAHGLDRALLSMLRTAGDPAAPAGPAWLLIAMRDVTSLGSITVLGLIVLLTAGLFASLRHGREALVLLLASLGGMAISQGLKAVFARSRPEEALRLVEVTNASFPSGHAMLSAVVYLTLGVLVARFSPRRRVKAFALTVAVLLALLVGISRIYLGVHWPTDVLAGWSVGAAWAMACWLAAWRLERGRAPDPRVQGA